MFHRKFNSICFIALSIILSDCLAQLTFHNDALMNSFTLKAPGVQQSFSRYFGGKRTGSLLQAAAPQHQYQQPQLQPNSLLQQQQQQPQQYSQYQQQLLRQPFAYTQPQQFSRSVKLINRIKNCAYAAPLPENNTNASTSVMPKFTFCRQFKPPKSQCQQSTILELGEPAGGGPVVTENVEVHVYKFQRCSQNNNHNNCQCEQKNLTQQKKKLKRESSQLNSKQNKCKKLGISGSISKTKSLGKRNSKNVDAGTSPFKFADSSDRVSSKRLCRPLKEQAKDSDENIDTVKKLVQFFPVDAKCIKVTQSADDLCPNSYSASTRYQQPSTSGSAAGSFPFESDFQQPLPQSVGNYASYQPAAASYAPPQMAAYAPQQQQQVEYRTISQPISQSLAPAYADQLQQMNDSYQQEQLQAQQMQAQQQRQQEQLLMDLYKQTPQGQGRAVTESPGRSQAFYTADQYINFLNRQHQDVFSQQQNQADNRGFQFSPMSAYSPSGVPATTTSAQYSPASNVSHVNYSNGKLSYNY